MLVRRRRNFMFDRQEIYKRFARCYAAETPSLLAKRLGLNHATTFQWRSGTRPVPWKRVKKLADEQGLRWDWLLEGKGPKFRPPIKHDRVKALNRHAINRRFLSLFPSQTQTKLGETLGVSQVAVFKWRHDEMQIPWEKLKCAVDNYHVTWEWLLEGRR